MRDWTIRLLLLLLVAMPITMEAKEKDKPLIYEVSCGGSANQGFYLVNMASAYIANLIFDKCRSIPNRKLISHTIKQLFGWQRKAA